MLATQEISLVPNPFPGLRPFRTEETHLFFGREGQVDEVLEKLQAHRFIAVLGTSGSGKSSLMYCGLIPSLHGGFMPGASSNWRVVVARPGIAPIRNLAEALMTDSTPKESYEVELQTKLSVLRSSSLGLLEIIKRTRQENDEQILLLVDQFEELFRFNRIDDSAFSFNESALFVKLLVEVVRQRDVPVYVVMTMRSDYIGDCAQFPQFTSLINESHFLIPQMTREQKREAILGPVAVGQGSMTPRLVQRLLNDLGENPDQLPILQHALMRTWNYWKRHSQDNTPVDLIHYEAIGRMEGALSQHADEAYEELSKPQREICEVLFKTLTEKGNDGRGVRRPTRLGDIAAIANVPLEEVMAVIERFRMAGRTLLMPPPYVPLVEETIVDISHESLMRIWVRCREWVEDEAEAVKIYLRLSEAAALHQAGQGGLWRPPDLQLALAWRNKVKPNLLWAERHAPAFERTMVFLTNSQKSYEDEQRSKDRLQKRAIQRQKVISLILTAAVIGAIFLVIFSYLKAEDATKSFQIAQQQTEAAQKAQREALQSAEEAEIARMEAQSNLEAAEVAAEEARRQERLALEEKLRADLQRQLAESARLAAEMSADEADSARRIAIEQQQIAQESFDRARKAREEADANADRAKRLRYLSLGQTMAVKSLRLSDTVQRALVAKQAYIFHERYEGNPYHPDLYDGLYYAEKRLEGDSFNVLSGHQDAVRALLIAPKSNAIFSASSDGKILQWQLASGPTQVPITRYAGNYIYRALALSDDEQWLACGTEQAGIQLINLRTEEIQWLSGHTNAVWSIVFNAKQNTFFSTGADGQILRWTLGNSVPEKIEQLKHTVVKSLTFDRQGILYGLLENGKLEAWQPDGKRDEFPILEMSEIGTALTYLPQKHALVVGYASGKVYVWNIDEQTIESLEGHNARISDLALSASGKFLATASLDGTVRIWQAQNLDEDPIVLSDLGSWAQSVAFDATGQHVVLGTVDKTIRYYPTHMKEMSERICGRLPRNMTDAEWEKYVGQEIPREETCERAAAQNAPK